MAAQEEANRLARFAQNNDEGEHVEVNNALEDSTDDSELLF